MGRDLRRVPLNWQHPRDEAGRYLPMYDQDYESAAREWRDEFLVWEAGKNREPQRLPEPGATPGNRPYYYWEIWGAPPDEENYRPAWTSEEATAYQVYESVSEGTPVSPVFATEEDLRGWLRTQGYPDVGIDRFIEWGHAPSMAVGPGGIVMNIHALAELEVPG